MPTLDEGIQKIQFDNIIIEFLSDRGVSDSVTKDDMIFQYTYWPQPQNQTMILHRTVDISYDNFIVSFYMCLVLKATILIVVFLTLSFSSKSIQYMMILKLLSSMPCLPIDYQMVFRLGEPG